MLSTLHGLDSKTLDFPNLIRLTDLPKNFSIQLEVYGLQTMRESLDHETKYHIKKDKPGLFGLTPKLLMGKHESRYVLSITKIIDLTHNFTNKCLKSIRNDKKKPWIGFIFVIDSKA